MRQQSKAAEQAAPRFAVRPLEGSHATESNFMGGGIRAELSHSQNPAKLYRRRSQTSVDLKRRVLFSRFRPIVADVQLISKFLTIPMRLVYIVHRSTVIKR